LLDHCRDPDWGFAAAARLVALQHDFDARIGLEGGPLEWGVRLQKGHLHAVRHTK